MIDRSDRLGTASIPRLLLAFSLPAMVGTLAQGIYYFVDRIFVGRALGPLGTLGIAGITVCLPFMLVLTAFAMLVGFGATAVVSIRLGQRKKEEAEATLGNAVVLLLVVSAILTAVGLVCLDPVLRICGASDNVLPFSRDYLKVIVFGAVFQIGGFGLNAVIRGEGNPRVAMLTLLIGVVLNVALAPLFLFRFGWGMKGAAWATVLSQAVSATWVLQYFLGGKSLLRLRVANLRLSMPVYASILAIGLPACLVQLAASVMNVLLINQLKVHGGELNAHGGDVAISAWGIIYSMLVMFFLPILGMNQGVQPIAGYNYGARHFGRVKRVWQLAVLVATGIAVTGFAVMMLLPAQVIQLFVASDPALLAINEELLAVGCRATRLAVLMLPLVGFQVVTAGYFQAVGKPKQAMLLMLSRQLLLLIPAVLILPRFLGLDGVWLALPTADFAASALTGICFFLEMRHLTQRASQAAGGFAPPPAGEYTMVRTGESASGESVSV